MPEPKSGSFAMQARAPIFHGLRADRRFFTLKQQAGRPCVLILVGRAAGDAAAPLIARFRTLLAAFAACDADCYILVGGMPARILGEALASGPIPPIDCGSFVAECGLAPGQILAVVLDRDLRVALRLEPGEAPDLAAACLDCVRSLPRAQPPAPASLAALPGQIDPMDQAPVCAGMWSHPGFASLEQQCGRATVLLLAGAAAAGSLPVLVAAFVPLRDRFAVLGADLIGVVPGEPAQDLAGLPIPVLGCTAFVASCRIGAGETLVLVLDRSLRVAGRFRADEDAARASLACLEALPREAPRDVSLPAPVLVMPNLLPHAWCRHLIDLFEASPAAEGTVAVLDAKGLPRNVVDPARKRRLDLLLDAESSLQRELRDVLLDRCRPAIARAFQARVEHTDRLMIVRYDAPGGRFARHRDNDPDGIAFREFALSVNLNGDYRGGQLMFPEYNDHRHAPPTGGGLIFSASVLHEVAAVTEGRRYALLTFLHGAATEAKLRAHLKQPAPRALDALHA
jgi:predicted 2-oxoglutarate/Fe(II)-dependent dioxygenase YbiX